MIRKNRIKQKLLIVICALYICVFLPACQYEVPKEKLADVISGIAGIVNDNYTNQEGQAPLRISMTDIEDLADDNSELKKAIEKYDDIKHYDVYLLEKNMVMVITDVPWQGVEGYVVSNEELNGTMKVPGMGFDNDLIGIINRIEDRNIYSFSAGL